MFKRVLCAIALVLLAGCGGAGEGNTPNGDLAVYYSYGSVPLTFQRFGPLSIKPDLGRLGSNKPHFRVISGRMPDGLQLNENTGEISGVPTSLQKDVRFSIGLRVDGFSGELKAELQISTIEVQFYYGHRQLKLQLGEAIPAGKVVIRASQTLEHPESTVGALTFSVDPATPLPPGLSLNVNTGEISGAPTQLTAGSDVIVRIVLSYGGASYAYTSDTLKFIVYAPVYSMSYGQDSFYVINDKAFNSGAPFITQSMPGDTLDSFQIVPDPSSLSKGWGIYGLPPELVFDPATGIISGVPAVPHPLNMWGNPCTPTDLAKRLCPQHYWTTVAAVFHRGTYSETRYVNMSFQVE